MTSSPPPDRWGRVAGIAVLAIAAAALAWTAFGVHVVGDYYAESDFYGGYADGARLVRRGQLEPTRYPVVGPGFDVAVAAAMLLVPDPFTAAKLVSVVSAVGALALWWALLARRLGPWPATATTAFLASLPVFVRHGYSASTDMLCVFLQAGFAFALLGSGTPRRAAAAGALAGLATLTRYSSAVLIVAGAACLFLEPATSRARGRGLASLLAGFLVVVGPWWGYSMAHGQAPAAVLFERFGFYATADPSRNIQDVDPSSAIVARGYESFADVVRRDPAAFGAGVLRAVPDHLTGNARDLLGWPAAGCVAAGLAALVASRSAAPLAPIGLLGASLFASLLLVFYSERYSLPLAPFYLAAVGGLAAPAFARRVGHPLARLAAWGALGLALVATIAWSVDVQRRVHEQLPREAIPAGRAIAAQARPTDRLISRKGHVGYYAGIETIEFPRLATLEALGAYAHRAHAAFLYYSWYECFLRPEFAYLLDSTATLPGLTPVFSSSSNPAVVFRIGPEFGRAPAWLADPSQRAAHEARGRIRVLPAPAAWSDRIVLAVEAAERQRWDEVLRQADAAVQSQPDSALGWTVRGDALRALDRFDDARGSYRRAMALDPEDVDARVGIGWVELASGHEDRAAEWWLPIADRAPDPQTAAAMVRLFTSRGDALAAERARSALRREEPGR